jgi:hypothetical protein
VPAVRRGGFLAVAAVASGAALAVLGAPALALEGHSAVIEPGPGSFESGKAKCEQGQRVVSGGFLGGSGDYALVSKAVRGKAWLVKGEFTGKGLVFANCSSRLAPTTAKEEKRFTRTRGDATARCGDNQSAVAGGWAYRPLNFNNPIFTSRPSGSRWTVEGFVDDLDLDPSLTAYAYCLGRDVSVEGDSAAMPADGDAESEAECDPSQELLGGGFETTPRPDFGNETGPDPFIYGMGRTAQFTWSTLARNYSAVGGTLRTFAVCLG